MKKLILFDLDGTLLDTLEDLSEAVNHALGLRGLPPHTLEEYRGMVGHGVRSLVQQALESSLANPADTLVDAAWPISKPTTKPISTFTPTRIRESRSC